MVADTRLTTKIALKPTSGNAKVTSNQLIDDISQASIGGKCITFAVAGCRTPCDILDSFAALADTRQARTRALRHTLPQHGSLGPA